MQEFMRGQVLQAGVFATKRHAGQVRGDGVTPYITHPLAVASILFHEAGVTDSVTLQAALLHDTIEDCDVTREDLAQEFGALVADVVHEVTNDIPAGMSKRDYQVQRARVLSVRAAQLKIADKTANLRDLAINPPRAWSSKKRRQYFDDARAVVLAMPDPCPALLRVFNIAHDRGVRKLIGQHDLMDVPR